MSVRVTSSLPNYAHGDAPISDAQLPLRDRLIAAGLLVDTGENGLYGHNHIYEGIVERLTWLISCMAADQHPEVLRFPPAVPRKDFEDSEYLNNFPHLAGTIHAFCGDERDHRRLLRALDDVVSDPGDERSDAWLAQQKPTRAVLTPAACYPVYPVIARRGPLPENGLTIDVLSYCFRHEPSLDPTRMQMFRMREYVRIGSPEDVQAFRATWIERGHALTGMLRLPSELDVANDPFFGRGGKIVADSQRAQQLKFELLIPVTDRHRKTACLSFNYHMDHFGRIWKLRCANGAVAHSACIAFGMERLALALLHHHGCDVEAWPDDVRELLWGNSRERIAAELECWRQPADAPENDVNNDEKQ
ncbi:amino acid--[acyl-carrier-protein] ligase [Paraburkholderia youngii]|uniref:amino acid--[acyl-carrier-protein] ligase n=1 Tax=Paraburkholderia youngii TaxID=2782701 RepID=UPI003D1FB04E